MGTFVTMCIIAVEITSVKHKSLVGKKKNPLRFKEIGTISVFAFREFGPYILGTGANAFGIDGIPHKRLETSTYSCVYSK